jgi:hypothetical protein
MTNAPDRPEGGAPPPERGGGDPHAAVKGHKKRLKKPEQELEEGLRGTFPASDPPTATRPGGPVEDCREKPRKK